MTDADIPVQSGYLIPETGGMFGFQWNPHKTVGDKRIPWNKLKVAGREQPILQYGCAEARLFHIKFALSRADRGPNYVKGAIEQLYGMCACTAGGSVKRPPRVRFIMGDTINVNCVISNLKIDYGPLWTPELVPCEAYIDMVLTEYK